MAGLKISPVDQLRSHVIAMSWACFEKPFSTRSRDPMGLEIVVCDAQGFGQIFGQTCPEFDQIRHRSGVFRGIFVVTVFCMLNVWGSTIHRVQTKLGPGTPLDRRDTRYSAGSIRNQPSRPPLRPHQGHICLMRFWGGVWSLGEDSCTPARFVIAPREP